MPSEREFFLGVCPGGRWRAHFRFRVISEALASLTFTN
jgi:hypothetical protein